MRKVASTAVTVFLYPKETSRKVVKVLGSFTSTVIKMIIKTAEDHGAGGT